MSTSARHHIPFPRTFLSLNTPAKKSGNTVEPVAAPVAQPEQPAFTFLSNRPVVGRHASVSSVNSVESVASEAAAPSPPQPAQTVTKTPTFLSLNTKSAALPPTAKDTSPVDKHPFLSNRK